LNYLSDDDIFNEIGNYITIEKHNIYILENGERIIIRRNRTSPQNYWYNIQKKLTNENIDFCIFVIGLKGFYKIPFNLICNCINNSWISHQKQKSPNNYKVVIHRLEEVGALVLQKGYDNISISQYYHKFNSDYNYSYEILEKNNKYIEGSVKKITVNAYERNQKARIECIKKYGAICNICGFDFKKKYGDNFSGIIEVHHKKPLSEIKINYEIDPINDLIPVCSNCHTILHKKVNGKELTVEEVQALVFKQKR